MFKKKKTTERTRDTFQRLNELKKEFPLKTLCDGEAPASCTCDRREAPFEGPFSFDNLAEIVKE